MFNDDSNNIEAVRAAGNNSYYCTAEEPWVDIDN